MLENSLLLSSVIAGLAVGIAFMIVVVLMVNDYNNYAASYNIIPVIPKISQASALQILVRDLMEKIPANEFQGVSISKPYNTSQPNLPEYVLSSDYLKLGGKLTLVYYHRNGTLYYIDSVSHQITSKCIEANSSCGVIFFFHQDIVNVAKGRLMYILDISCSWCFSPGYVIDANTGQVIFSDIRKLH
jgi:hypothetical protein